MERSSCRRNWGTWLPQQSRDFGNNRKMPSKYTKMETRVTRQSKTLLHIGAMSFQKVGCSEFQLFQVARVRCQQIAADKYHNILQQWTFATEEAYLSATIVWKTFQVPWVHFLELFYKYRNEKSKNTLLHLGKKWHKNLSWYFIYILFRARLSQKLYSIARRIWFI